MTNCLVFACSGRKYAKEALDAAARAREVMPDYPLVGFADAEGVAVFQKSGLFTETFTIPDPAYSFIDKTRIELPDHYDAGLFLDTDTFLADRVDDVFEILDRFDMAVAHEPTRFSMDKGFSKVLNDGAPQAFPELNTGVIAFRNTTAVRDFFRAWASDNAAREASGLPPAHDQPAFRTTLWQSDLRFYVLPPEFNFRFAMPGFIGGFGGVKILHGRAKRRDLMAPRLAAAHPVPRTHQPWWWPFMARRKQLRRWRRRKGLTGAAVRRWIPGKSHAR